MRRLLRLVHALAADQSANVTRFSCAVMLPISLLVAAAGGIPASAQTPNPADGKTAIKAHDFLSSLGVNAKFDQGADPVRSAPMLKYLGIRALRANGDIAQRIRLHQSTGVLISSGLSSGPKDVSIQLTLVDARALAQAGALLSLEGANEPNNFSGTYQGQTCCKDGLTWLPMAKMQRDFYAAVKADPILKNYPVFAVSVGGAQTDNVGLQFLTIPPGAGTLMPDGTAYADFANVHNYVNGINIGNIDNQAFLAAAPFDVPGIDGLFGEFGLTWARKFKGYAQSDLVTLPKVTTETGYWTDGTPAGDDRQGKILLSVYLSQYKAGWKYTFVYELMDFTDGKNGFYADYDTPRKSAHYLHNLTTILADKSSSFTPGKLNYSIPNQPATVHDMLMQKSDGTFELVVWGEQIQGSNALNVKLGATYASVKLYDVTVNSSPIAIYSNINSLPLTVSDHPLVIEIRP